jgi:hypothetical protein
MNPPNTRLHQTPTNLTVVILDQCSADELLDIILAFNPREEKGDVGSKTT